MGIWNCIFSRITSTISNTVVRRSRLYVDDSMLVDNEGLHGAVERCGTTALTAGTHVIYIEGFQAGGAVFMDAKYVGPDTGEGKVYMIASKASKRYYSACDPNDKTAAGDTSQFTVCMFQSNVGLSLTPRIGDAVALNKLQYLGKGQITVIDMHDVSNFRQIAPNTPDSNYVWAIYGSLKIIKEGTYNLCISSDDGYDQYQQ
jgi:hypothetical protein